MEMGRRIIEGLSAFQVRHGYHVFMARTRRWEKRQEVLCALQEHLTLSSNEAFIPAETHHVADIADVLWLDFNKEEARRLFQTFPAELSAEVLAESEPKLQNGLLEGMDAEALAKLLELVSADDGTDILEVVGDELRQQVLCFIEPEDANDLRHLSEYPADSAGGLMTTEFITVRAEEHVGDLLKRIKRDEGESETIQNIYVTDEQGILEGVVSNRELLEASIHDEVGSFAIPDVIHARVDEDQEEVAHKLLHYNLSTIPVVDLRSVLVGIVTADDALEVLEEEGTEDALLLAGAHGDSHASESLFVKVLHRAPMLVVTVMAGLLMSRVMEYFAPEVLGLDSDDPWRKVISYIPMVLALSGTIGMQTSAVLVRGFAVGQITEGRRFRVFLNESQVGATLGLLCGLLVTPAATFFGGSFDIGLALGLALFFAMGWAATASSMIALGSEHLGFDPALVSGPIMMAVSDLSAVFLFFGTATLLLG